MCSFPSKETAEDGFVVLVREISMYMIQDIPGIGWLTMKKKSLWNHRKLSAGPMCEQLRCRQSFKLFEKTLEIWVSHKLTWSSLPARTCIEKSTDYDNEQIKLSSTRKESYIMSCYQLTKRLINNEQDYNRPFNKSIETSKRKRRNYNNRWHIQCAFFGYR